MNSTHDTEEAIAVLASMSLRYSLDNLLTSYNLTLTLTH